MRHANQHSRAGARSYNNAMNTWPAESIWERVFPLLPGFTVEVLPEIDSSNTELMRRARAGQTEPTLLVAERQTAGRGRLGRPWQSAVGDSLTFSLGLPFAPRDWSGLSLAVGLSLAESLHTDIQLKWPNDLWVAERKLAGILIEAATAGGHSQVVIGIGINIHPRSAEGLSTPPAALSDLWPQATAGSALLRLMPALVQTLRPFEQEGFAPLQRRYAARDLLQGRQVQTGDGLQGHCLGVSSNGSMRLLCDGQEVAVNSSEVSVRPRV